MTVISRTAVTRSRPKSSRWDDGTAAPSPWPGLRAGRRKFLKFFPRGFKDPQYFSWERGYKWRAHEQWQELLDRETLQRLLRDDAATEIAQRAVRIEARTNLLFSFEKMALRDAVKSPEGAHAFAAGLFDLLHGRGGVAARFERWCAVLESLPRRQTRVLTWPVATVFGFLAQPEQHIFLKPNVTRRAAAALGFEFRYESRPTGAGYAHLLEFAGAVQRELRDLAPRDFIDVQSFLWVLGSDEYD